MPTYEYRCTNCQHELEAFQKFSDPPLSVCPVCNGQLRKVFNSVGVIFKGSGFYSTDNHSKGAATGPKPESKSDSAASATSESSASASTATPAAA
jgi:putative FmdB family regulatory protein